MPAVPRLPFVPDLLRRIRLPDDLDAVTTAGTEAGGGGSIGTEGVERIWECRAGALPQRGPPGGPGVRPARGRGRPRPRDRPRPRQRARRPGRRRQGPGHARHPVHRVLGEQGDHRVRRPQADRARPDRASTTRSAKHIPGYERHGKGEITIGQVLSHRAGVPNLPREALEPRIRGRPRVPGRGPVRREAVRGAGQAPRLPRDLGRVHPRRGRRAGHRQGRSGSVLAEEFLDPLGFRWTNYGVAPEDVERSG